jgi:RNA polymerase sigma-70 factor (ECF subfamily)
MNKGIHGPRANQNLTPLTILERIANNDKSAVKDCLEKYENLVWNLTRKFTNSKEDAEDAVQEIFIDIWKNAFRFDPKKSPEGAFVTMIARRRLIDSLRKHYRRPIFFSFEYDLTGKASDAHQRLELLLEVRPALDALNKLSDNENQIIRMSVFSGISHGEIAKAVGLPLGTVKTRIRRGLIKLRLSLGLPRA